MFEFLLKELPSTYLIPLSGMSKGEAFKAERLSADVEVAPERRLPAPEALEAAPEAELEAAAGVLAVETERRNLLWY